MPDSKTIALVTGASAGLGAEFCRQLAARCDVVIGVARRQDRLDALSKKHAHFHPIAADVTDAKAMRTAVKEAIKTGKKIKATPVLDGMIILLGKMVEGGVQIMGLRIRDLF